MPRLIFLLTCLLGFPALAVQTSYWTQTTEQDFKSGTLENVVATNHGDIKLSRAVKTLLEEDPRISAVNALAEGPDGSIYAGTGPNGVLLRIRDGKVDTFATLEGEAAITALLVQKDGAVLAGTSGDAGRVLKFNKPGEKPKVLFKQKGMQYVWAIAQAADGMLYAATGPEGKLFAISPDGTAKVLLDTDSNNLTCLISDGKDLLYAGTDTHGLVYRINRKTGESFVLYNAPESEISALALDKQGNLYAATAEAREQAPGASQEAAQEEKSGRPEGGAVGVPIPSDRPREPAPPAPPNPNPGQPNPIPKTNPSARIMMDRGARVMRLRDTGVSPVHTAPGFEELHVSKSQRNEHGRDAPVTTNQSGAMKKVAHVFFAIAAGSPSQPSPAAGPNKKRRPKPEPGDPEPSPDPDPGPAPSPAPRPGKPNPPGSPQPGAEPVAKLAHQPAVDTTEPIEPRPEGTAIYKIDPEGFVTEVFRQPTLILGMVESNGVLLVATGGPEGQVYQVRPAADETLVLAKVDAKEIMCLLSASDGKTYMGTANVGSVASMSVGFAARGTFTSPVLDATQISRFGKIHMHGSLPVGAGLAVATRSGNVKEADEKSWSKWSDDAPAAQYMQVPSPSARFLQYRLTLTSAKGAATPVVEDVAVAYQVPNLPPRIKSIKVVNAGGTAANAESPDAIDADNAAAPKRATSSRYQTISWEASDPNHDALAYALYFRPIGQEQWILLKDKLMEPTYQWDTRTAADGRYEVKVIASDAGANPPGMGKTAGRVSDPLTVDNTPPVIGDLKSHQNGGAVQISLKAVDRTSTVASVDYAVDSSKDWQFVLPDNHIYDSPEEAVAFSIPGLSPGQHQITVRATDAKGNQSFENIFVNIQSPAARAK